MIGGATSTNSPTIRRPTLAAVRADYDRVLRQRTALLKTAAHRPRDPALLHTLDVWDGHLAQHGARLLAARVELVNQLRPEVEKAYQLLAPGSRIADIRYRASIGGDGHTTDAADFEVVLTDALGRRRDAELDRGVCLVGPHRDDLELLLGDQPPRVCIPWRVVVDGIVVAVSGVRAVARGGQ